MFQRILVGAAALLASSAIVAHATPKEDVQAAIQKLIDAPNYSWTSVVEAQFGGGTTEGKTEKGGYTVTSLAVFNNNVDVVSKGDKSVVKTQDGSWKTPAEVLAGAQGGGRGNPDMMAANQAATLKTPSEAAKGFVDKLPELTKADDAYTADLTADMVKEQMAFRGRGRGRAGAGGAPPAAPDIKDPKGTLKIWVKDGVVSKVVIHFTASISFNGNDFEMDNTRTVDIKDVGTTKVDVPADAKTKLDAPAPATPAP